MMRGVYTLLWLYSLFNMEVETPHHNVRFQDTIMVTHSPNLFNNPIMASLFQLSTSEIRLSLCEFLIRRGTILIQ